ncbi:hypothetical protein [Streptomyces lavendofoliae]|uniref:Uncharacterized protein n=1 Tax=Streptomyces lavendofoliae TaxID=67314 RepID=A0A918M6I9_9ACTN|nr:hypothetical protein [Streptomyces lavendofoliae]GGU57509.1 hypothetical protein GCM10010274_53170 [Streptomyces lavendofoliae]
MVRRRVPLPALAMVLVVVVGGLWWWAVLRLALAPGQAGMVEATVAAGGWGLSLLPVHVASARTNPATAGGTPSPVTRGVTAWLRRRSDAVRPGRS